MSHGLLKIFQMNLSNFLIKATGQSKKIGLDHAKEFITDSQYGSEGILILKSKLIIGGYAVYIEPILHCNLKGGS